MKMLALTWVSHALVVYLSIFPYCDSTDSKEGLLPSNDNCLDGHACGTGTCCLLEDEKTYGCCPFAGKGYLFSS